MQRFYLEDGPREQEGKKKMRQRQTKAIQTKQATDISRPHRLQEVLRMVRAAPWGCAPVALVAKALLHCPSTSPACSSRKQVPAEVCWVWHPQLSSPGAEILICALA